MGGRDGREVRKEGRQDRRRMEGRVEVGEWTEERMRMGEQVMAGGRKEMVEGREDGQKAYLVDQKSL